MSVSSSLRSVQARINVACELAQRLPEEVTLIAVSKTQPIALIKEAYDAGQRHFGESRLQEAIPKIENLPSDIVWHFIGTLQSNKARKIATLFSVVHTFCKEDQIIEADKANRSIDALIEINIANEPQKAGIDPKQLDEYHRKVLQSRNVHFRGLMTIGPAIVEADNERLYFRALKKLGESVGAEWLSMGMSGDFESAIQEGATHVRVGTAIFGSRQ
jgi:pyridoxal phosphate enzyme (YggS family)